MAATTTPQISDSLDNFFDSELRNTREAIGNGDLDPGFPCTLDTAVDSLAQIDVDIWMMWFDLDPDDPDAGFKCANIMLELAAHIAAVGADTSLADLVR